jgi:hypothetical protein
MTTTNPFSPRRSHRPRRRRNLLALALLATISLSACGGGGEDGDQATGAPGAGTPDPSPGPSPASGDQDANSSEGTPIRITFGDTVLTARLYDNATARDLAAQLPLTLTFSDLNNVEKIAPLPRELSLEGAPEGADPEVGDIGYWSPDGNLVFYYGDVGFWNGIVRIGEFDGEMDAIERQSDDFSVTIERAE